MNKLAPTSSCFLSEDAYEEMKESVTVVHNGGRHAWRLSLVGSEFENLRRTLLTLMGFPHNFI
jgi:hypothetical protein